MPAYKMSADFQIGGTDPVSEFDLAEENRLIVIEDIRMFDGAVFLSSSGREIKFPHQQTEFDVKDELSEEELAALYAEAAQEDEELARLGLAHYAQILEQEEQD